MLIRRIQWDSFPERPPVDAEGLLLSNSARLTSLRRAVRPLMYTTFYDYAECLIRPVLRAPGP